MDKHLEDLEKYGDVKLGQDLWSSNTGDSNAIIMPQKKKNRKKGHDQFNGQDKVKNSKLSKSQTRKLKKIQEEKEKELLLYKSIQTLEKHKIQEDLYSLLRSSRNIGQVETVQEKRRRAVQFSKMGLEQPLADEPSKGKCIRMFCENEPVSCSTQSKQGLDENNFLQSMTKEKETQPTLPFLRRSSQESSGEHGVAGVSEPPLLVKGVANENTDMYVQEDFGGPLPKSACHDSNEVTQQMDLAEGKVSNSDTSNIVGCPRQRVLTTPIVVHVSRPKEVEETRKDLPIVMMEQEIMEAINEKATVIICGETGCGKTTQVPQFLYEAGFGSNRPGAQAGIIGVTQPRRVAVRATAKRVAYELGLCLKEEVGFQVRHDRMIGQNSSIKFMTDGILLREVQNDFLLKKYSVIVLDEAHERSLNTDILIGMLSRIILLRQNMYEEQQQKISSGERICPENQISSLKLVLMSATLRVEDFVSGRTIFCKPPPVINVPARQYPVTIHFSKRTELVDYMGQAHKKVLSIHKRLPPGGILVFVTGRKEVEDLCRRLLKASQKMGENNAKRNVEDPTEEYDMEMDEAYEPDENADYDLTNRFSSFDEEHDDLDDNESDLSDYADTDSDLEEIDDDRNLLNQKTPEADTNPADVFGERGSFASLKAAFEALAGKTTVSSDSNEAKMVPPGCLNKSISTLGQETGEAKSPGVGAMRVLPLYAMLPGSAQDRVFQEVKEGERLVVVATNVAETSLTIPGIKYVVDTGREKVKKYNSSSGMETYEIQWISKASANQRSGRAGRTGPGHCYRLYSSAVYSNQFPDFSSPQILKVPIDGVVLMMKALGIAEVSNFPFPTPPEASTLTEAELCLTTLEALDSKGKLTPLGKAMAKYPMSPRHSRVLLTVIQIMRKVKHYPRANLILGYAVAAAAALSLPNPFIMQFEGSHSHADDENSDEKPAKILDKEEKLRKKKLKDSSKVSRARYANPSSDVLTVAYALQCFELSGCSPEFCNSNLLHLKTMEEMSNLRKQLLDLVFDRRLSRLQEEFSWSHGTLDDVKCAWRVRCGKCPLQLNEEEILGQAICAGWADRVAKRIRAVSGSERDRNTRAIRYEAYKVEETVFLHRWSSVMKYAPEFLVYSELLHTKRPYIHGATSVKSDWLVKYAGHLCTFPAPPEDSIPYYNPLADEVYYWSNPIFGRHHWKLPLHCSPIKDDASRVRAFAFCLLEGHVLPCFGLVREFMAAKPACILKPEASGHKRIGNLLNKLKTRWRIIDNCAKLREAWNENPRELYSEILDWFQEGFRDQFEVLWARILHEACLNPEERFPKRVKRDRHSK